MRITKAQEKKLTEMGYDLPFVMRTQPQGGMVFGDRYITAGDGYIEILHLYAVADIVPRFWLIHLMNNTNTVALLDIATADKKKVIDNIDHSITELRDRVAHSRTTTERDDYNEEIQKLRLAASNLNQGGEVYKIMQCRIAVYGATLAEVETQVDTLCRNLGGKKHKLTIDLFRTKSEWLSMFQSYDQQSRFYSAREGVLVPANSLGGGIPFHHDALSDPFGIYMGKTTTGGPVIWDIFRKTLTRKSFNGMILGKMGFGKSTMLKILMEGLIARGCFIRGFDKARDYYHIVRKYGGKIIDLGGGKGMINPLQVYATRTVETAEDEDKVEIDEYGSFLQHLAKMSNQLKFLDSSLQDIELSEFEEILLEFYVDFGLLPEDYRIHPEHVRITGLAPEQYPVMSDLNAYLKTVTLDQPTPERRRTLEKLRITVNSMTTKYGPMFNGYTTIRDLENEQVIFFDIDGISQMSKSVFNCQLFTALTLIWSNALTQGRRMKKLVESGKVTLEDVAYFAVLIDECQNIINVNNAFAVEYVTTFQREMRKFYAGVWFATQTPNEVLPENASEQSVAQIKKVFELTQYKMFFNMDTSTMGRMRDALGQTLTDTEYDRMSKLEEGEAILQLSANETLSLRVWIDDERQKRFKGGV